MTIPLPAVVVGAAHTVLGGALCVLPSCRPLGLALHTAPLPTLLGAELQRGEASLEETGHVLR